MAIPSNERYTTGSGPIHRSKSHVVMMVANDLKVDTRVRKVAEALASTGVAVTVVGLDLQGDGFEGALGLADLVVLKTRPRYSSSRLRRFGRRSSAYPYAEDIGLAKDGFQIRRRAAASEIAWIREDAEKRRRSVEEAASDRKTAALDRYSSARLYSKRRIQEGGRFERFVSKVMLRLVDRVYRSIRSVQVRRSALEFKWVKIWQRERERYIRRRLTVRRRWLDRKVGHYKQKVLQREQTTISWWAGGLRRGSWRRDLPEFDDYEAVVGPFLDALDADVFHAHDVHLLGVATRAAARARYRGGDTKVIYDAHEYIAGLAKFSDRTVEAFVSVEREYIHRADRVITVSEPLASLIQRDHDLDRRPDVVLNIPVLQERSGDVPSLYEASGVPRDAQLMVYSGGLDEARNVHTIVKALPLLPDRVHLVLVTRQKTNYILSLFELADELGVGGRLHLAPFVEPNEVVSYLSEATLGIHAMISSKMNHQIALPNKIFEYLYAGLPMCVSDNAAMMNFVIENGVGEWFIAEDPSSLALAVVKVLDRRDEYVDARYEDPDLLERLSWVRQAEVMVDVYRDILGEPDLEIGRLSCRQDRVGVASEVVPKASLAIGSLNQAGQADLWARALTRNLPNVDVSVFMLVRPEKLLFPASDPVSIEEWWNPVWQQGHRRRVSRDFTHVLIESGSLILGGTRGTHFDEDLPALQAAGISTALVFHGSDVRDPNTHRGLVADSPFHVRDDFTIGLEASTAKMLDLVRDFDGPVFVSTKDLFDYIPHAVWLPQVVDVKRWTTTKAPMRNQPVVVATTFTSRRLKGADVVDAACKPLAEAGRIEYRQYNGIPPADMPAIIADVDVLIDGVSLGLYGTTAVEGMAAGRVVLANIDRVIDKPGEVPPIINVDSSTIEEVLEDVLNRPARYRKIASSGPEYVRKYHDGRFGASQLAGFLAVDVPATLQNQLRTDAGVTS